ncbi:acyl carrier protein [Inquilinus sp. CA228]|uniref:acyl carrier protein n=1 Tax=Inquilinus sp. CA228 TaxID=3455609 RepID=UPI003F8D72A0
MPLDPNPYPFPTSAPDQPYIYVEGYDMGDDGAAAGAAPAVAVRAIVDELGAALPIEREGLLLAYLKDLARQTLGYGDAEPIAPDQPLVEQGFDSLMSVDMRNRLVQPG